METYQPKNLKPKNSNNESEDPLESIFERGHKRKKYENFSDSQLETLNTWFAKSIYPKIEDFDTIANEIIQPKKKIQNWFKYKRRLAVLENENKIPQYKTKKVLSPKVFDVLKEYFKINQNPCLKEFRELAKKINLKEKQIISWFTYRRRKLKLTRKQQQDTKGKPSKSNDILFNPLKDIDSLKYLDDANSGNMLTKKLHLEMPENRFLSTFALPTDNSALRMPNSYDNFTEFNLKKEFTPCPNIVGQKPFTWPAQTKPGEMGFNLGQTTQFLNMLPNAMVNQAFNNFPFKMQNLQNLQNMQNMQNFQNAQNLQQMMMRNSSQNNLANLQLLYNKMMPKINMLPYLLKDNLSHMNQNMTQMTGFGNQNAMEAMLKGGMMQKKLEIKQETI